MRQPDNMKAAQGAGLDMNSLDFEFMTKGDPITDAQDAAGRIQQNLTPEEMDEMANLAPYAEKFMMLSIKAETGKIPSEQDVDQLLAQLGQEMPSTDEQGMPSEQGSGAMMPEYMQSEASVPPMPVEGQMPQNAPEMMAEGGYARSSTTYSTDMEQAYAIVRKKHPRQAKYLDSLNIVMNPNMAGHSEYRSGDYEDADMYGGKHTIEINPKDSKTPEEIASTIAGETLHHMKDKDPEFRKMWLGLRETLGEDENFRGFQEKRQRTMNKNRQEAYIGKGRYKDPVNNKGPYNDTRDVDHFIDASAMDEWIRAYQFKDDPIAGKHYDPSWQGKDGKGEVFHNQYKDQFEGIKQYLKKGMAVGGVVPAGPAGVVDQPGADGSGVGDDVPVKSDGFVINAAAVRHAGLQDINDMIQNAKTYAEKQGAKLDFGKSATGAEDILVSNGEVVIPDVLANIIGYDKLEKINNRGKKETEEKLAEQEQQPTAMQPQQPVMAAAEGLNVQKVIDRNKGPFPVEDEMIREEVMKTTTPFIEEEMINEVDMDKIKEVYSLYWNPETKAKTQEGNRRDYKNKKGGWMTHLEDSTVHALEPGISEAIREVMPAFDSELKSLNIYNPNVFEYFAKIESRGGKDLINKKSQDYGAFQVNMANASKYFKDDDQFRNFAKFYGKKAAAITGISAYTLRKVFNEDPKEFQQLMIEDPKLNLAVGLAITLLPNMWKTRDK